jgi:DNA-binding NtrC family response regulator
VRLGAYRYLEKPFQLGAILQVVQEATRDRAAARDSERAGGRRP